MLYLYIMCVCMCVHVCMYVCIYTHFYLNKSQKANISLDNKNLK